MDKEPYNANILYKPQKPNGKGWRFFEIGIINVFPTSSEPNIDADPINIQPTIQYLFDSELTKKDGMFSSKLSIPREDEDLDKLLCVEVYGMKCSFQPFLTELKNNGVVDLFGQDLIKLLFEVLHRIGSFMKDNTDKPQAIKNNIISMLEVCRNAPLISAMIQICVMRGVEVFLQECLDVLEGYGVAEVQSLLEWVKMEECKLISSFTVLPLTMGAISQELAEHIKPFTDYLYSTELGKLANDTTLATLYGYDITDEESTQKELPKEFTTPKAKVILQKAVEAGFLNSDFKPTNNMTQAQQRAFAIGMGLECGFFGKHLKPFKTYWGVENLGQVHIEGHSEDSIKKIKLLFSTDTRQKMQEKIYGK